MLKTTAKVLCPYCGSSEYIKREPPKGDCFFVCTAQVAGRDIKVYSKTGMCVDMYMCNKCNALSFFKKELSPSQLG